MSSFYKLQCMYLVYIFILFCSFSNYIHLNTIKINNNGDGDANRVPIMFHKFQCGSVNPKAQNNNNICTIANWVLFVSPLLLCMGIINASFSLTSFTYTHNTSYKLLKPKRWNNDSRGRKIRTNIFSQLTQLS